MPTLIRLTNGRDLVASESFAEVEAAFLQVSDEAVHGAIRVTARPKHTTDTPKRRVIMLRHITDFAESHGA